MEEDNVEVIDWYLLPELPLNNDEPSFGLEIVIPGQPAHKARPRIQSVGKFARMYNTKETKDATKIIAEKMRHEFDKRVDNESKHIELFSGTEWTRQDILFERPCAVSILAMYELPKSKHRKRKPVKRTMKTSKPDVDNITKIVLDAGNGILWKDDAQVVQCSCAKYTGAQNEKPYMLIRIIW